MRPCEAADGLDVVTCARKPCSSVERPSAPANGDHAQWLAVGWVELRQRIPAKNHHFGTFFIFIRSQAAGLISLTGPRDKGAP